MASCHNCQSILPSFEEVEYHPYRFHGFEVQLKGARVVQCTNCKRFNLNLKEIGVQDIYEATARELIDFPELTGDHLKWAATQMIKIMDSDLFFSGWVDGFLQHTKQMLKKKWLFSELNDPQPETEIDQDRLSQIRKLLDLAQDLLAKKLGFKTFIDLQSYFGYTSLPKKIQESLRIGLGFLPDRRHLSSVTTFNVFTGKYHIIVDLSVVSDHQAPVQSQPSKTEKPTKKPSIRKKFKKTVLTSRWQAINKLIVATGGRAVHFEQFESNCRTKSDRPLGFKSRLNQRLIAVAVVCQRETKDGKGSALIVDHCVVASDLIENQNLIMRLLKKIANRADKLAVKTILLRQPLQDQVLSAALAIGFRKLNEKWYVLSRLYED